MEEPPAKRARRIDSTAMWERNETSATSSPRPQDDNRELRHKGSEHGGKRRGGDHRPRSRSRERNDRTRERSKSPRRSDRDRDKGRGRDRARDTGRDRDREGYSRQDHDRSRSRDRPRGPKDHARRRSRSPVHHGTGTSARARSPPRGPRTERDQPPRREKAKDDEKNASIAKPIIPEPDVMQVENPTTNGHADDVAEEDSEDALLRKMMGFSTFKSTQNTKVPGNNVYGVRKEKKTEYRQYMNRVGGFNRPLSPTR